MPPFWASRWAYLLYILGGILATGAFVYFYIRHMRKESEERFQRESLMRDKIVNEERMKFFTNVTHELRTPLTLILGPLDDLKDDKGLSSDARSRISKVRGSAGELLTLINQLLDFRKTETANRRMTDGPKCSWLRTTREYADTFGNRSKESTGYPPRKTAGTG